MPSAPPRGAQAPVVPALLGHARHLTEPHPEVEGLARRRRARLAAALLLVLLPLGILFVVVFAFPLFVGRGETSDLVSIAVLAAIVVGYLLVRTPRFQVGILLVLAAILAAIWAPFILADRGDITVVYYSIVPVLLGGLLLETRIAVALAGANTVGTALVPWLRDAAGAPLTPGSALNAFLFLLAASVIGLTATGYLERSIRQEEEANVRLRQADEFRLQLLNTVAHDLASPLTPLTLQLRILRGREGLAKNVETMERNVALLQRLVADIKDLAKIESARLDMQPAPTDLAAIAHDALEGFGETARDKGVEMEVVAPQSVTVRGDRQRLTQAVYNLTTNAIKFTPPGGRVVVSVHDQDGHARVHVRDSGRGLDPAETRRLFQPFSQVHERAEVEDRGTGLGLFITKGIVEAHGGEVGVESAGRGRGSTFWFRVPLEPRGPPA